MMGKWWEAPSDLVGVPHVWRPGNPILEGVAQIHCRNLQQRPSRGGTALGHVRWLAALLHCWCFTERRKILKPQWILSRPRPCLMSAARMGIPDRIVHLMRRLWEITGFWGTKGFNFWSQHHGSGCFKKCHGIQLDNDDHVKWGYSTSRNAKLTNSNGNIFSWPNLGKDWFWKHSQSENCHCVCHPVLDAMQKHGSVLF